MQIKFLKDFPNIQHHKDEIKELNEMDTVNRDAVTICLGHGSYYELKIDEDVELLTNGPNVDVITLGEATYIRHNGYNCVTIHPEYQRQDPTTKQRLLSELLKWGLRERDNL